MINRKPNAMNYNNTNEIKVINAKVPCSGR